MPGTSPVTGDRGEHSLLRCSAQWHWAEQRNRRIRGRGDGARVICGACNRRVVVVMMFVWSCNPALEKEHPSMTRTNLRRVLTALSFLAVIMGGTAAPAVAAATDSAAPACWWSRCEGQL